MADGFLTDLWYALGIQNQGGLKKEEDASKFIYDVCIYLKHNPDATNEEAIYAIAQGY